MQEKITSLIIQYPYNHIEIGLAHNDLVIDSIQEDKHSISRRLIPDIDALLQRNNLTLSCTDYITINCGPGPLNTLRGILATANAIHFTKQIPLVTLDALELLESEQTAGYTTIPILQAFSKHVYLRYKQKNYDIAFDMITSMLQPDEQYYFVGNGAMTHAQQLHLQFPKSVCTQEISFPSLEQCAQAGWKKYQAQEFVKELSPVYL
jgi:tRNA A37 threonylcarbamoyladenosine modification protein TsaB